MKMSEIPQYLFDKLAVRRLAHTVPDHLLGGTRTIAPLKDLGGYAVLADHPALNCSSC